MTGAANTPMVSEQLARFVAETQFEQLSDQAIGQCRYALLDALGVSIAATTLGEGVEGFVAWVGEQQAKPECTVIAHDLKTTASMAAFANGALAHALDFEDAHDKALVHPNAAGIPAALAIAQTMTQVSGKQFLSAIAVGCEVVCRLGLSLKVSLDQYGWYPPPILSAYGATATAAHLLGLTTEQTVNAFSLTLLQATCSAEIKYNPRSHIRAIRDAFPAQAGVVSAQLAKKGVAGFAQPFEGEAGFFAQFARGHYQPSVIVDHLGESFEIANLSFKPWPSCRGTHTAIELALQIIADNSLTAGDIESVTVYGNELNRMLAEPIASKRQPQTAIDAKFSIPFCVASAIVGDGVDLDSFSPSALRNPEVLKFAARVNYIVDNELNTMLAARVEIFTSDDRRLSANGNNAYGCPQRPMSERDLIKKFANCLYHSRRRDHVSHAQYFVDTILAIDQQDSLVQLFDCL